MLKKLFILWVLASSSLALAESQSDKMAIVGTWELVSTYCEDQSMTFNSSRKIERTFTQDGIIRMDMSDATPGCEMHSEIEYAVDGDVMTMKGVNIVSEDCSSDMVRNSDRIVKSQMSRLFGVGINFEISDDGNRLMIYNITKPVCGRIRVVQEFSRVSE